MNDSEKDLLWKQYELEIGLYKHYLELTVKFNVFYYAGTGAILSYYFSRTTPGVIRYSLLFPIFISITFGALFIYGASLLKLMRNDVVDIGKKLGLGVVVEFKVLEIFLIMTAVLMFFVAGVLVWLFYK